MDARHGNQTLHVDVEVIAPHAGIQEVRHLAVCVLLPCRHSRIPDQLPHVHPICLATNVEYLILGANIKHIVARLIDPRKPAEVLHRKIRRTRRLASLAFKDTPDELHRTAGQVRAMVTMEFTVVSHEP